MKISVQDLVNSGIIGIDDVKKLALMRRQEVLMEHNIETPKILSRMKKGKIRYYCNVPSKCSRTGSRHQITGDTPEEVEEAFQAEAYEALTHEQMTVQDLIDTCLKYRRDEIKLQTYERYQRILLNDIRGSKLGKTRVSDVKAVDCESFIRSMYTKEYTHGAIEQIKSLISTSFDYGISHEYMTANYMRGVKISKNCCAVGGSRTTGVWTDEEIGRLWAGSLEQWNRYRKFRYSAVILLLIYTGMRIGELLALTWDDVNWDKRQISINKTMIRYTDYETGQKILTTDSPKNMSSRRVITLNDVAIFWLQEIQRRNIEAGIESDLIVSSRTGHLLKAGTIDNSLRKFCKKIGIGYRSCHAARRTYVSIALDSGKIPINVVSRDLGHKKISTTQDVYYKIRKSENELLEQKNIVFSAVTGAANFLASAGITQKEA